MRLRKANLSINSSFCFLNARVCVNACPNEPNLVVTASISFMVSFIRSVALVLYLVIPCRNLSNAKFEELKLSSKVVAVVVNISNSLATSISCLAVIDRPIDPFDISTKFLTNNLRGSEFAAKPSSWKRSIVGSSRCASILALSEAFSRFSSISVLPSGTYVSPTKPV